MIEIYDFPGSLCCQKVKLVLAEKNIEWQNHLINLLSFENLQPSYIRLNPKGVVPTLIHDGQAITDSVAIVRYLDEQFPQPPLIPADFKLQEKMNDWINLQNQFPMRELMYSPEKIAKINTQIEPMLTQLEKQLSQTDWLCGVIYSLADAMWTAVLNRLDELKFSYLWAASTRPALRAYFNRLKTRPSFKAAIQSDEIPLSIILAGLSRIFLGI